MKYMNLSNENLWINFLFGINDSSYWLILIKAAYLITKFNSLCLLLFFILFFAK